VNNDASRRLIIAARSVGDALTSAAGTLGATRSIAGKETPFPRRALSEEIQCERRVPAASCRALIWAVARDDVDDVLARFVRRM
jgi:hypothetical protein